MRTERELLVNQRDAAFARVERRCGSIRRSAERHLTAIGAHGPGEDRHECALARTVLAEDGVDFARVRREIDAVERDRRGVPLSDPGDAEGELQIPRVARDDTAVHHPPLRYLSIGGARMSFI